MLTCLFVLFVCVITQNEQVVAVANDDDALESDEGSGDIVQHKLGEQF